MLKLGLVGCGGMGRRHLKGLRKLTDIGKQPFQLVGVTDVIEASADGAADVAAELLGHRPRPFQSLREMHDDQGLDALIITTAPDTHAQIGIEAMSLGIDVLVEKPIALTTKQGIALVDAAATYDRVLAVAENYRRDPVNRLAKAVIDAGMIGKPYLIVQSSSGAGERVIITPWRHRKLSGGIVVDMGIHYADLFEYFLGPIESVFGFNGIIDEKRIDASGAWHEVDAEDISVGVTRFANGAIGNWLIDLAGRGNGHFTRTVHGTTGSLDIPHDRTGKPVRVSIRSGGDNQELTLSELLDRIPDLRLDPVTAALFGGERAFTYEMEFTDIDASLLAIEQADFAAAIAEKRAPEVDGAFGLRSLAISYGFIEAEREGRALAVNDLIVNLSTPYQSEIDAELAKGATA